MNAKETIQQPILAATWRRALAGCIDLIIIALLSVGFSYLFQDFLPDGTNKNAPLSGFSTILFATYYVGFEALTARSPGKWVAGTRVLSLNNTTTDLRAILIRSGTRVIPFESMSALFPGLAWHDNWSKTKVVVLRPGARDFSAQRFVDSALPKELRLACSLVVPATILNLFLPGLGFVLLRQWKPAAIAILVWAFAMLTPFSLVVTLVRITAALSSPIIVSLQYRRYRLQS